MVFYGTKITPPSSTLLTRTENSIARHKMPPRPRAEADDAEADLECTICLDLPPAQIFQCRRGHLMCEGCFNQHRTNRARGNHNQCPTCRVSIAGEPIRSLAAEREVARRPANCRHCGEQITRGQLEAHQEACPNRLLTCEAEEEGCAWTGRNQARK